MIKTGKIIPVSLATMVILGSVALGVSANDSTTATTATVPMSVTEVKGGGVRGELRAAVKAALDANDYDAWVKAESNNRILPDFLKVITKDNFAKFVSMHQLMKDGKKDEAKVIADELGLKMGGGRGGMERPKMNEAAEKAITNGDYAAWVTAESVNGQLPDFLKVVTKDNFSKFVEAHGYQKQAQVLMQKSDALMNEIGIKRGPGFEGRGGKRGERGGQAVNF